MQVAWRERNLETRISTAHKALDINPECATALILLAEEECKTVRDAEQMFKKALKAAEVNYRKSQQASQYGGVEALIRMHF